jgi:CheY-like chemotaxis protein
MSLAGKRILLVEDEYLVALYVTRLLEEAGAVVLGPVPLTTDAMQIVRRTEIDAAVLDVNLSDGPCYPVAEALTCQNKPFVFVTAYERSSLPVAFRHAPRLTKPVLPAELLNTLEQMTTALH